MKRMGCMVVYGGHCALEQRMLDAERAFVDGHITEQELSAMLDGRLVLMVRADGH